MAVRNIRARGPIRWRLEVSALERFIKAEKKRLGAMTVDEILAEFPTSAPESNRQRGARKFKESAEHLRALGFRVSYSFGYGDEADPEACAEASIDPEPNARRTNRTRRQTGGAHPQPADGIRRPMPTNPPKGGSGQSKRVDK